ncbi:MAG: hypothetical protein RJA70_151 [Pseudomonadota bacterium]|jgi:hypothetical protein
MMRITLGLMLALSVSGCIGQHSSGQRLVDSARELNEASRFGRMDVAAEYAAKGAERSFLERRSSWGNDIRVVDINVAGIEPTDTENAIVLVQVAWTHMAEGTLHTTTLKQYWEERADQGWRLAREQRASGDAGLFGEASSAPRQKPQEDVHFPSKSLGASRAAY